MQSLQEAIERITYVTNKFPEEEFRLIEENAEEAKPYLRAAVERAIAEQDELEDEYMLHFFALFFLGQFQDKAAFERIVKLASLPDYTVDFLLGSAITEGLKDILYNTYNGNLGLLKNSICNPEIDEYVRDAMLEVMGQLYLDGTLEKDDWQDFLKELVYLEDAEDIQTWTAGMICRCHLMELLPEVRYICKEGNLDPFVYGTYEDFVDEMFAYKEWDKSFCASPMSIWEIRNWATFEDPEKREYTEKDRKDFEKELKAMMEESRQQYQANKKIGRNDPCPCGSGKKYKHCCLNRSKDEQDLDAIEKAIERRKYLENYPQTGGKRVEGRIYLEDYFDSESIAVDKRVYLALHHRAIPILVPENQPLRQKREREYLWNAFCRYAERMEREGLQTNEEYDKKYSIHYRCKTWLYQLLARLEDAEEFEQYDEVLEYYKK
ncbi:MAG: DUF1186 domain-containing protein [Firmicutes bacterium]|nr:DUF1186 domain-containing protein [Bacillota bacterium]